MSHKTDKGGFMFSSCLQSSFTLPCTCCAPRECISFYFTYSSFHFVSDTFDPGTVGARELNRRSAFHGFVQCPPTKKIIPENAGANLFREAKEKCHFDHMTSKKKKKFRYPNKIRLHFPVFIPVIPLPPLIISRHPVAQCGRF